VSLITWTPAALSSSRRRFSGACWRVVEAQHRISTMKLVDSPAEQAVLEEIIEASKPPVPEECAGLDFLLYTPFRYDAPYPIGSRFRRAGFSKGVFYASRRPLTAIAEMAFHRLLFYAESPATEMAANPGEYTAFSVPVRTTLSLDLTMAPLNRNCELWERLADYAPCQALADVARDAGMQIVQYHSMRDPGAGKNYAVLTCKAFAGPVGEQQSWRIQLRPMSVWATCEAPRLGATFDLALFLADPRLAPLRSGDKK